MASIPGTVIAAKITTGDTLNSFPVADQNEIKGGLHSVATLSERDAIAFERRIEGMQVYVADGQLYFSLMGGVQNSNWQQYTVGSDTGSGGGEWDGGAASSVYLLGELVYGGDVNGG